MSIRDQENGDQLLLWDPTIGVLFPKQESGKEWTIDKNKIYYPHNVSPGSRISSPVLESHRINPIYTLIPFDGWAFVKVTPDVKPYLPIDDDSILTYDHVHLDRDGQLEATRRLFNQLQAHKLIVLKDGGK